MRSTVGKLVALWAAALPTASAFTPLARVGTAPHSVRVTGAPATFAAPPISAQVSSRSGPIVAKDTVVAADFKLALGFAAAGALILALPVIPGGFCLLFGLFLVVQTLRIRFVFDDEAFEVKTKELDQILSPDAALANTGENFVVGGANRWAYSSFVNWDFFPSEQLPSEQTPPLHAVSSSARSSLSRCLSRSQPSHLHRPPRRRSPRLLQGDPDSSRQVGGGAGQVGQLSRGTVQRRRARPGPFLPVHRRRDEAQGAVHRQRLR